MSETRSTGSSSSSSSTLSLSDCGELEVAKVLATLAAKRKAAAKDDYIEDGDSVDANSWGTKAKRSTKRLLRTDSELCPSGSGQGPKTAVPLPFDLNVDQAEMYKQEECENRCQDINVKVEVCESAEPGPVGNGPHSGRGKTRQNLTEAEKEARRLRRILANRESARQTIRRRQALYEELTLKAAALAAENENLKRSKELAVMEFQSLQNTNQNLKEKVCQTLGFKVGEPCRGAAKSSESNSCNPLLSANWPLFLCNTPSASPFMMPSCTQPSVDANLSQLINQHALTFSNEVNPCLLQKKENALNTNTQTIPWCIIPCPWFLPISNMKSNGSDQLPFVRLKYKHEELVHARNGFLETPFGYSCEKEVCTSPNAPPAREEERAIYLSKEEEDATAGAEARKRRKELMKLKGIHCFPSRGYG